VKRPSSHLALLHDPEFVRYGQQFMSHNAGRYSILLLICVFAWWPMDLVLLDDPKIIWAMAVFRLGMMLVIGTMFAVPAARELLTRHTAMTASVWMAAGMFVAAFAVGHGGSLEDGWAHYFSVGFFAGVAAAVAPLVRIRISVLIGVSGPLGFFLARPEDLSSPAVPALVLFYVVGGTLSVLTGHAVASQLAIHFGQERDLKKQREELDRLSQDLEGLVAIQTQELRALAHELQEARDEERRWMAAEMHDGLGQQVASLGYALAFVRRSGLDASEAREVLGECGQLLGGMNANIAEVLEQLRPEAVERGLEIALEELVISLAATWPVHPELQVELSGATLGPDVALAAYRVVQEGLSNALKHAQASRVDVLVTCTDGQLSLAVQDDGVGFDSEDQSWSGFGLSGIQSRVTKLGGVVQWERGAQRGTTLKARLPVSPSRAMKAE
jgi:signal transduction histidine kinase